MEFTVNIYTVHAAYMCLVYSMFILCLDIKMSQLCHFSTTEVKKVKNDSLQDAKVRN